MNTELLEEVGLTKEYINSLIQELTKIKNEILEVEIPDFDRALKITHVIQAMNYAYNGFLVNKIKNYEN